MNAKLTTLFLSSVVCTGLISGLLVEPSNKLTGNLIQPAQAQACNGPTFTGIGSNATQSVARTQAMQSLINQRNSAGVMECGPITSYLTRDGALYKVTLIQSSRSRTWAEWGGTFLPEWAY